MPIIIGKKRSIEETSGATAESATNADAELIEQVSKLITRFFRKSLNWSGGDDELTFKSTVNSLVEGRSYYDPDSDDGEEHFIIRRKGGIAFTESFLTTFRPELVKIVNTIIDANNEWLKTTNYHEAYLQVDDLKPLLDLKFSPSIPSGCSAYSDEDIEMGPQPGTIGLVRASGNRLDRRWDFQSDDTEEEDQAAEFADQPKGEEIPLEHVAA